MNRIFHFVFAVTLLIVSEGTLFAQCCSYTLVLEDSYGDGWNGAELEVFINDDLLGIFQAVNDLSSVSFEVCPEDEVELHYSSGNWENENEYSLFDSWGLVLFEDGPNPDSGWVYSNEADCDQSVSDGDTPCVAYEITAGECETADNSGMIDSGWNPWCANYQGEDVWFSLEVPTSGNI